MKYLNFAVILVVMVFLLACDSNTQSGNADSVEGFNRADYPEAVVFSDIKVGGDLKKRVDQNFIRLQKGRYLPDSLYIVPNPEYHQTEWPGDMPGRLVLGLTLLEQAVGKKSQYLDQILAEYPDNMNEKGYFGKIYGDKLNEQQLSSHGWVLRALCEHYERTGDEQTLSMLKTVVDNLVLPTKGRHKDYPIEEDIRDEAGSFMGTHLKEYKNWILSTDIGCDFIFMDGVVHACQILQTADLFEISEEMIKRFLEVDLLAIRAQTHATLTGLRAVLRYYEMTQKPELLKAVEERYALYKAEGMTENFENYNWFNRPRWTEPCAVVDSYIAAIQLWRFTGKSEYLRDAQLIYYNGLGSEQRANGGYGCNSCTGNHDQYEDSTLAPFLRVKTVESHWCCTMRGAEGLTKAVRYNYFTKQDTVFIGNFVPSKVTLKSGQGSLVLVQTTDYPYSGHVDIVVDDNTLAFSPKLVFAEVAGMSGLSIAINGEAYSYKSEGGYVVIDQALKQGDKISIDIDFELYSQKARNKNTVGGYHSFWYGPLMLGLHTEEEVFIAEDAVLEKTGDNLFKVKGREVNLRSLHHLMDARFSDKSLNFQVLFKAED